MAGAAIERSAGAMRAAARARAAAAGPALISSSAPPSVRLLAELGMTAAAAFLAHGAEGGSDLVLVARSGRRLQRAGEIAELGGTRLELVEVGPDFLLRCGLRDVV